MFCLHIISHFKKRFAERSPEQGGSRRLQPAACYEKENILFQKPTALLCVLLL